ncbi:MAG: hypothetical protein IAE98_11640 [Candidatus Kapabacteria bacterium]|nr:hypothetical protein [Candidatus Kapabacteria bacterium]
MKEKVNKKLVVYFNPPEDTWKEIKVRVGNDEEPVHQTARRDMERYYKMLKYTIREAEFTQDEAFLICHALKGTLFDDLTIRLMYASVEDAIKHEGLDKEYDVDGAELVVKLKHLSVGALYAVADAVERWWLINHTDNTNNAEKLKSVGLIR